MPVGFLAIRSRDAALLERLSASAQARHGLTIVHASDYLVVLTDRPAFLPVADAGVVIGRLFVRGGASNPVERFSIGAAHAIDASRGDHLLSQYWGGYVAILEHPDGTCAVLRDPSGQVPCYIRETAGVTILASRSSFAELDGVDRPRLDWTALGFHLGRMSMPGRRTCLDGVSELLAGERLLLGANAVIEQAWSPWQFAERATTRSDDLGRIIVDSCVSWSRLFDRVCLTLSGGLDSSVVAVCLADEVDLRCLNFLTPGPSGDERWYAQLVAERTGAGLQISELALDRIDLSRSVTSFDPRPAGRMFGQATDAIAETVLEGSGRGAQFNGEGGDNVFCCLHSPLPAIDRLLSRGSRRGCWQTLKDTTLLTGASLPHSASWAVRRLMQLRKEPTWRRDTALLHLDVVQAEDREPLPDWLSPPASIPPGKRAHGAAIYRAQIRKRMLPSGFPVVSPLVSQPIVEAALAIPTWAWCEGGGDRIPVRRAFRERLPQDILARRWKGGPDGFAFHLIRSWRDVLRTRLLDGVLAAHNLIDRIGVEQALSDAGIARGEHHVRILELAEAEAWAGGWLETGHDRQVAGPGALSTSAIA
jgi:asparagine synthase (glutamine-hydrolysing)